MTSLALLFTLAAFGIAETAYLIEKRYASEKPVCPIGGGCRAVLESKYNRMFGVHNDILGFGFYVAVCIISGLFVVQVGPTDLWNKLLILMVGGSAIMSLVLIFIQWKIVKHWCFWCLMSSLTVGLMALIIIISGFDVAALTSRI